MIGYLYVWLCVSKMSYCFYKSNQHFSFEVADMELCETSHLGNGQNQKRAELFQNQKRVELFRNQKRAELFQNRKRVELFRNQRRTELFRVPFFFQDCRPLWVPETLSISLGPRDGHDWRSKVMVCLKSTLIKCLATVLLGQKKITMFVWY